HEEMTSDSWGRSEGFVRSTRWKLACKNDSSGLMFCSPASIELTPTPSRQHGPSVLTRRHPGGNQDRRGRTPAESFFRLTLSREFRRVERPNPLGSPRNPRAPCRRADLSRSAA